MVRLVMDQLLSNRGAWLKLETTQALLTHVSTAHVDSIYNSCACSWISGDDEIIVLSLGIAGGS